MIQKRPNTPEFKDSVTKELALAEQQRAESRFIYNLKVLGSGDVRVLRSDEFIDKFIAHYLNLARTKSPDIEELLDVLGDAVKCPDDSLRERAISLLSILSEHSVDLELLDELANQAILFCKWLLFEEKPLSVFPVAAKNIAGCCSLLLIRNRLQDVAMVLDTLSALTYGKLEKNNIIKSYTGIAIEKIASRRNLEFMADQCLGGTADQRTTFTELLLKFGQVAVEYLFERMNNSLSRKERMELIDLIASFKFVALPVLSKQLDNQSDWKIVRNGVRIYGELGDENVYPLIKPYLRNKDHRVQYEAICSVLKIGGDSLIQRLIEGASIVDDSMKTHMLRMLFDYNVKESDVYKTVNGILAGKAAQKEALSGELLKTILGVLKTNPSKKSMDVIKLLKALDCYGLNKKEKNRYIEDALRTIRPLVRHQNQKEGTGVVSYATDPAEQQKALRRVTKVEAEIKKFLQRGDSIGAGKLIYNEALAAGSRGDFRSAELLKNRLLEVDPMALEDLWRLDRMLQDKQNAEESGISGDLKTRLLENFSQAECNAIIKALRPEAYREGDRIVNAGETDCSLFFVSAGALGVHCYSAGEEIFLKKVGANAILGGQQFFSVSVWTTSVHALTDVKLLVLDSEAFSEICQKFPYIEPKLREYCLRYDKITALLEMTGADRREFPRYSASLEANYILLDPFGYKTKKIFRGKLLDISKSGLSIKVGVSSKETARMLLGRQIITSLKSRYLDLSIGEGVIVGVRTLANQADGALSSVHVRLSRTIDEKVFRKILAS